MLELKGATMLDARRAWTRLGDLPEDLVDGMPEHIRATFVAARLHRFEVEMLAPVERFLTIDGRAAVLCWLPMTWRAAGAGRPI